MDCNCEFNQATKCSIIFIIGMIILTTIVLIVILSNQNQQKDILTAIAVQGDNTQQGTTTIKFSQNDIVVGNALTHEEGSDAITINETGIYQISYQLFGVQDVTGTFNFNAVLLVNNTPLNDTFNQSPVIRNSTSNRMTLTSTVILRLNAGDILKLQGVSIEDITYQNARIDIEKIG